MGGWNFIDRTGMTFGKLKVQKYLGNKKWLCHCECGNDCIVNSDNLPINGKKKNDKILWLFERKSPNKEFRFF